MEYPKMLYTGNKVEWSCRAVQTAEEEDQARENGLVDYAELPEQVIEELTEPNPENAVNPITTEQFNDVAERLAVAEREIKRLHEVINAPTQDFVPEIKYADSAGEVGGIVGDTAPKIDYSTLTTAQLQEALAEKGIEFKVRDSKAELLALLEA